MSHRLSTLAARATILLLLGGAMTVASAAILAFAAPSLRAPASADTPASPGVTYPAKLQALAGNPKHLAVDSKGALWFAVVQPSGENTLYRYVSTSDTLNSWPLPARPGGGWFLGMAIDSGKRVWVAWDQTLVSFDITSASAQVIDI